MKEITDQVLRRLEALAKVGEGISTNQVREVMHLTPLQLHTYTLQPSFPARQHIGRMNWVNPEKLLAFAHLWNKRARGCTLSDVAALLRCTVPTARRLARSPGFPRPLGQVHGRDRWDRAEIIDWHRPRLEGARLPPGADVDEERPQRKRTPKGGRNGKPKSKTGARA